MNKEHIIWWAGGYISLAGGLLWFLGFFFYLAVSCAQDAFEVSMSSILPFFLYNKYMLIMKMFNL